MNFLKQAFKGAGWSGRQRNLIYFVWLWAGGNSIYVWLWLRGLKSSRPEYRNAPPPSDEHRMFLFDRTASDTDKLLDNFNDHKYLQKKKLTLFRAATGHVLEIGAGTGRNFEILRPNNRIKSLTCVEVSLPMCEVMRKKLEEIELPFPVCVICGDICGLPFAAETFDSVISTFTFCSVIGNVVDEVRELCRVSKKNARLLFMERGLSSNPLYRWLLSSLHVTPNPGVPWELGFFEDRIPTEILRKCSVPTTSVKHANFGLLYLISTIRPAYNIEEPGGRCGRANPELSAGQLNFGRTDPSTSAVRYSPSGVPLNTGSVPLHKETPKADDVQTATAADIARQLPEGLRTNEFPFTVSESFYENSKIRQPFVYHVYIPSDVQKRNTECRIAKKRWWYAFSL